MFGSAILHSPSQRRPGVVECAALDDAADWRRRCLRAALADELVLVGEFERADCDDAPSASASASASAAHGRLREDVLLLGRDDDATDALDGERERERASPGGAGAGGGEQGGAPIGGVLGGRAATSFGLVGGSRMSGAIAFFGARASGATAASARAAVGRRTGGGGRGTN